MSMIASAFPPSFAGNPWSYGFALFSLTLICALSIAMLLGFLFEARARAAAVRIAANPAPPGQRWATPLTIHRSIIIGFLLTILLGAMPDVLILYFWGEAAHGTIALLFTVDRLCDGLTIVPFGFATVLSAWGVQTIPQALIRETQVVLQPIRWAVWRDKIKIVVAVLVIATGVTLAKASA